MKNQREKIEKNIDQVKKKIQAVFAGCFDAVVRDLRDVSGRRAFAVYFDGLVNKQTIQDSILKPLVGLCFDVEDGKARNLEEVRQQLLWAADVKLDADLNSIALKCMSGDTAVFIDGCSEALVIQTRGWQSRGISPPDTQRSIRGPKEGFTETMLFNVAMLRRKLKTPLLKTKIIHVGELTVTDVCVVYLEGIAKKELVERVISRISAIDVKYILESGHIEQLVEDKHTTVFSTVASNEKPDIVAGKLIKGRVAIIVDGTPFVLTVPMLFTENFQAGEDYYSRPFYANFLRLIRVLAYVITLTLPAFFVALVTFHQEMIPTQLLGTLIRASEGVPFSAGVEMFILLTMYELLREAMMRLPQSIGSAVGLAGVFLIGEAAVGVSLIGAPSVVVAAATFITSAVVFQAADSLSILRFLLLILGAWMGIFGVLIGLFAILAHLCTLKSFGYPYMMPLSPVNWKGMRDSIIRASSENLLKRDGM